MDLVAIARLRRSRGNRGEVIADSLTSVPERFQRLSRVFLRRGAGTAAETVETAQVEGVWLFRDEPVFKFAGVDSINAAELLAGAELCVPDAERVKLEEGEFFFSDIVGCSVRDIAGQPLGTVAGWQEGPGQVLFEIEEAAGGSFLVPFVAAFFREVDVTAKLVVVDLPAGLREMNR